MSARQVIDLMTKLAENDSGEKNAVKIKDQNSSELSISDNELSKSEDSTTEEDHGTSQTLPLENRVAVSATLIRDDTGRLMSHDSICHAMKRKEH